MNIKFVDRMKVNTLLRPPYTVRIAHINKAGIRSLWEPYSLPGQEAAEKYEESFPKNKIYNWQNHEKE